MLPILIANRGEIALRIQRSASLFPLSGQGDVRFVTLSIYTKAEANSAHVLAVPPSQRLLLPGTGPRAYLDIATLISLAKKHSVWGVAPGYGFLSESVEFSKAVEDSGMVWIGPGSEALALFGNKIAAKQLATKCRVPILQGTQGDSATLDEVLSFAKSVPAPSKVIIKAVAGGGGRGMRVVDAKGGGIQEAYHSCVREADLSFGDGRVYVERFLQDARHIEVQIVGDGSGDVAHVWERECTLQRRHQKLVEIAPSPTLSSSTRDRILEAALRMARQGKYKSLGTFEFLYLSSTGEFFFMEANPRIQVEHTITEQITGLDLVAIQLQIAAGSSLKEIGLARELPFPQQTSIQVRVNAEELQQDGTVFPTSGNLSSFHAPSGPGIRIDTSIHAPLRNCRLRYQHDPSFDSLLAKVIFTAPSYQSAVQIACSRLAELELDGIQSNVYLLRALLGTSQVQTNQGVHTRFLEEHNAELYRRSKEMKREKDGIEVAANTISSEEKREYIPHGMLAVDAPMAGILVQMLVKKDDQIVAGQQVALIESMKMEHVIRATQSGHVDRVFATKGGAVTVGDHILSFRPSDSSTDKDESVYSEQDEEDVDVLREDLKSVVQRKHLLTDEYRKRAVEKRRAAGFLTARENLKLLIDAGSFNEFGDFVFAAQRTRIEEDTLMETTAGDGVITGWATVNKDRCSDAPSRQLSSPARCALVIYDYMVLAGTQGHFHHLKLDRLFRSVLDNPAPLILYAEGGGGRPGDVDLEKIKVAGLDGPSFAMLALIRSRGYPTLGLANGYTFAGNAVLLGTCDIIVATRGGQGSNGSATSTGIGGPAMIEGGGIGVFKPAEVGPVSVHESNGGYDVVVADEKEASHTIKQLLSLFQGPVSDKYWKCTKDPKVMRRLLPVNRVRSYNVNTVIEQLCDDDSFIELGKLFGQSLVTGLGTLHGQPIAILASSVTSPLGGAIDTSSAVKATRFINMLHRTRLAHLIVLCDTPGFMVGPRAEKEGGLRAFGEFFQSVVQFQDGDLGGRIFAVTLRKAYGLGAQAMLGGSTLNNFQSAAWPMGEFSGMGIEGAVRLGMKKELEAVEDEQERKELFQTLVDVMYQRGKSENMAAMAEIDTVIDPKDTRSWLINGLKSVHPRIPTWKRRDDRPRL